MTGYYLLDNPPRRSQYRKPRREQPSGVIVLHSTESVADVNPPDTGAENVAAFIRNRATAGSYHLLCDSDTTIPLIPLGYEAFHDGTGTNRHSIGISGAFQAHQFASLPQWWRDGCIRQMALAARTAAIYVREITGIDVPARRITVPSARDRVPGFVTHGMLDPNRRTDPDGTNTGARFPWDDFFAHYHSEEEFDMDADAREQFDKLAQMITWVQSQNVALDKRLRDIEKRQVPKATATEGLRNIKRIGHKLEIGTIEGGNPDEVG